MKNSFLGPSFKDEDIINLLKKQNFDYKVYHDFDDLCMETAGLLNGGSVIGWFQGKMEFGPRALGNRSILANAAHPGMQKTLNLKIKFRESFRPFAPAVIIEDATDYFDIDTESPYMLLVCKLKKDQLKNLPPAYHSLSLQDKLDYDRSDLQAITHVDGSARIQTVAKSSNPAFYQLLQSFKKITGCSVLVNTSFNIKDEPIVCSPADALSCFIKSGMDYLVLHNVLISKETYLDHKGEQVTSHSR